MTRYVGLDGHSKNSVFVVQDESGQIVGRGTVPTTAEGLRQMCEEHKLPPGTPVALETGAVAFFIAGQLADLGLRPLVIDAREVRMKASRPLQKCDRRDALELCEGVRRDYYRTVVPVPPASIRHLRETLSRRRYFVRLKTAQVNAVKRVLRGAGMGNVSRSLQVPSAWARLITTLSGAPNLQRFVQCHREVWLTAHQQVEVLEAEINRLAQPWQVEIAKLMTVPGVGLIVSSTFLAAIYDAERFSSAKQVASYAGLVPRRNQSGERDHSGHIVRRGSSELRAMLCEAAHQARRLNNPLNPYFTRICAKRGYRMAVVAVAHRLCRILYGVLRDGSIFDVRKAGVEEGLFEKKTVRHYRKLVTAN